jgi:hypothetical protein
VAPTIFPLTTESKARPTTYHLVVVSKYERKENRRQKAVTRNYPVLDETRQDLNMTKVKLKVNHRQRLLKATW